MIEHPHGQFALFVGQWKRDPRASVRAWVNGAEQPRGSGRSRRRSPMDMRGERPGVAAPEARHARQDLGATLRHALSAAREKKRMPSLCSAVAQLVRWQCEQLSALPDEKHARCSTRCSA